VYQRLLTFLRCPNCSGVLRVVTLAPASPDTEEEISEALLHCEAGHWFPVVGGIPRMLPDALRQHWAAIDALLQAPQFAPLRSQVEAAGGGSWTYDRRTQENFSLEWEHHEPGGRTWGMDLDDRVEWFFIEPLRMSRDQLAGKVMLDAGCGNGSQSVAYTQLGLEVIAVDLSSGLENGHAFRHTRPGARPDRVHFVQGDLRSPPLAPASVDLIHSGGVLHHLPDTEAGFRRLCDVLAPGGTFFVWLYKYEPVVTPIVETLRRFTVRLPPKAFGVVAEVMAVPFQLFCKAVNALGIREYSDLDRHESALALMDIFGAPYAHHHTFDEVAAWYASEGFDEVWSCNDGRRGFGVCGRRAEDRQRAAVPEGTELLAPERS